MLELKFIRENRELVKEMLASRKRNIWILQSLIKYIKREEQFLEKLNY